MCKSSQLRGWTPSSEHHHYHHHPIRRCACNPSPEALHLQALTHRGPGRSAGRRPPRPSTAAPRARERGLRPHRTWAVLRARAAPPPPAAARGAHRPRQLRCWGQETDCFWREKQKGQKGELFLERAARCRGGPFPPPLCPSSNSTPGKLGFESSLGDGASGTRGAGGDAPGPWRQSHPREGTRTPSPTRNFHLPRHPLRGRSEPLPPAAGSQQSSGSGPIQPDHVPPPRAKARRSSGRDGGSRGR